MPWPLRPMEEQRISAESGGDKESLVSHRLTLRRMCRGVCWWNYRGRWRPGFADCALGFEPDVERELLKDLEQGCDMIQCMAIVQNTDGRESVKNHRLPQYHRQVKRLPQYHRQRRPQCAQTSGKAVEVETEAQESLERRKVGKQLGWAALESRCSVIA